MGTSSQHLLKRMGLIGPKLKKAVKDLSFRAGELLALAKKERPSMGKVRVLAARGVSE